MGDCFITEPPNAKKLQKRANPENPVDTNGQMKRKDSVIDMIGGMRCKVDVGSFQNDMTSLRSKDDVLTLFVHLGYLAYDRKMREVFIPNEEIRIKFSKENQG